MEVSCQPLVLSPLLKETNPLGRRQKDCRTGLDVVSEEAVPPFRYLKNPAVHVTVNHVSNTAHAHRRNSLNAANVLVANEKLERSSPYVPLSTTPYSDTLPYAGLLAACFQKHPLRGVDNSP
jgi:hypothetical protein